MKKLFCSLMATAALLICIGGCSDDGSNSSNPINGDEPLEESSSSSETLVLSSSETIESSSSRSSSSSKKLVSSSSEVVESSSSLSSSSDKTSSSSKEIPSSSSEAVSSSLSVTDLSSSSETHSSSSSVTELSSSSSSSSAISSSSIPSSSSENISSSSVEPLIPSKDYDCSVYRCLPTQLLNPEIDYGELLDVRDNQVYRTVKIGDQVWMAQNLNYDVGDTTPDYRFNTVYRKAPNVEDSLAKFGRAYTWIQAVDTTEYCNDSSCYFPNSMLPRRGICPEGWHVPSERDWKILEKFVDLNNDDEDMAISLKAANTWQPYTEATLGKDRFGFSALPFEPKMSTMYPLMTVQYWSSNEDLENAYYVNVRELGYYRPEFAKNKASKTSRAALRCLQD